MSRTVLRSAASLTAVRREWRWPNLICNPISTVVSQEHHATSRSGAESDRVEILSGVHEGQTTGTPIALLIRNEDSRERDYEDLIDTFRPGHADYTYWRKYGLRDPRGGGRSSARLTAPMVAAGAVAKKWLRAKFGTEIRGCMQQLGEIQIPFVSWAEAETNAFFAPDSRLVAQLEDYMDALRKSGDSVGARLRVVATACPSGLGRRWPRNSTPTLRTR